MARRPGEASSELPLSEKPLRTRLFERFNLPPRDNSGELLTPPVVCNPRWQFSFFKGTQQMSSELFLDRDYESFIRTIEIMNQMYRLQVSNVPTLVFVDNMADGTQHTVNAFTRLHGFKKTLQSELDEIGSIIDMAHRLFVQPEMPDSREYSNRLAVEILTAVADLLADIIVYCVSEMRKFGLPPASIMRIVMQSNMSKLQPDGTAKYDNNGRFLKGPNYFPPEPKLQALINQLLHGHDPLAS